MQLLECAQSGFTSCFRSWDVITGALKAQRYIYSNDGLILNDQNCSHFPTSPLMRASGFKRDDERRPFRAVERDGTVELIDERSHELQTK